MLMAHYYHFNYGFHRFVEDFNFSWDIINHQSSVVITASEGSEISENGHMVGSSQSPQRFLGAAPFKVYNVCPYDGGVTFRIDISWFAPLDLWVCITVFDDDEFVGI